MRRIIAFALLIGVAAFAAPEPAACVYCPSYTCYGSCGPGCVCLTPPGTIGGSCYGVERAPSLLADGWSLAP